MMREALLVGIVALLPTALHGQGTAGATAAVTAPAAQGLGIDFDKMAVEALKAPLKTTTFTWASGGMASVTAEPVATHICLLTEVSGNFAGGGERITLDIDKSAPGGARWVIRGVSGQPALRASITCARKDQFTPGMWSPNNVRTGMLPLFLDTACGPTLHNAFKGDDTAGFLREVVGKFRGGGEGLMLGAGTMGNTALHVAACSGYVGGSPMMLAFGGLGPDGKKGFGGVMKYYGANGRTTQIAEATMSYQETLAKLPWLDLGGGDRFTGQLAFPKIPVDKALCGIVAFGGKFEGYGERVSITPKGGVWVPDVASSAGRAGGVVAGSFRCIARDQR